MGGGGDAAEDVFGGLDRALKLSWSKQSVGARFLLHTCDAPGHGTRYHAFADRKKDNSWNDNRSQWDRFADFDSSGELGKGLMHRISEKGIVYVFLEIYPFTQKMTQLFQTWYDEVSSTKMVCSKLDRDLASLRGTMK